MGFQAQLDEILKLLPAGRQSFLFSATMSSAVSDFARAGLSNAIHHWLDDEYTISPDLRSSFFWITPTQKTEALLLLLESVANIVPLPGDISAEAQAVIFVATKHHVEYIANLLEYHGYHTAFAYGSLHQAARKQQLSSFRARTAQVLVVTDVAARGLDIPAMDTVVNFDFPCSSRQFVHRVGRTARNGRLGSAYSLVTGEDLPYCYDLDRNTKSKIISQVDKSILSFPQLCLDDMSDTVKALKEAHADLKLLYGVLCRSQKLYERTRNPASDLAHAAAKALLFHRGHSFPFHPAFQGSQPSMAVEENARFLARLSNIKSEPSLTLTKHRSTRIRSTVSQPKDLEAGLEPPDLNIRSIVRLIHDLACV